MPRPSRLTVTETQEYAEECGIPVSRPTIIKHMKLYGHQIGGKKGGKYSVNKEKFRKWLYGEK